MRDIRPVRLSDGGTGWRERRAEERTRRQPDSYTCWCGMCCLSLSGNMWLSVWRVQGLLDKGHVLFLQFPGRISDVGIYLVITVLLVSLAEL